MSQLNKPVGNDKRKHTPLTDEILNVIDQQPLNRYEIALRLTRWAEAREREAERRGILEGIKLADEAILDDITGSYPITVLRNMFKLLLWENMSASERQLSQSEKGEQ